MRFSRRQRTISDFWSCTKIFLNVLFLSLFGASFVQADERGLPGSTVIQLVEKQTDVFYLEATLGEAEPSEFLFDTGSGYLAINEKTLRRLKADAMAEYSRSINARLANGSIKPVKIYRIAQLDLGGDCQLADVEAAILPGSTRNIIGMNILKMVDSFSVSFNPSTLTLNGCGKPSTNAVASL